jgi:hypothetical protein
MELVGRVAARAPEAGGTRKSNTEGRSENGLTLGARRYGKVGGNRNTHTKTATMADGSLTSFPPFFFFRSFSLTSFVRYISDDHSHERCQIGDRQPDEDGHSFVHRESPP